MFVEEEELLHGPGCNCEDCWWAHDCEEVCPCCGIPVSQLTDDHKIQE